jgi:hypothetical protein
VPVVAHEVVVAAAVEALIVEVTILVVGRGAREVATDETTALEGT